MCECCTAHPSPRCSVCRLPLWQKQVVCRRVRTEAGSFRGDRRDEDAVCCMLACLRAIAARVAKPCVAVLWWGQGACRLGRVGRRAVGALRPLHRHGDYTRGQEGRASWPCACVMRASLHPRFAGCVCVGGGRARTDVTAGATRAQQRLEGGPFGSGLVCNGRRPGYGRECTRIHASGVSRTRHGPAQAHPAMHRCTTCVVVRHVASIASMYTSYCC